MEDRILEDEDGKQMNRSELTTDVMKADGGVYAVIDGVIYYYLHSDHDIDY